MATTVENSGRDIFALQQKILEENVKKYATEGERRSKLAMKALEGQAKNLSERGEKYYEMLTNTVKASEKAQGKQLEYSNQRISMIKDAITSASDLNDKERQLLENQVATVQKVFAQNQSNTSTLLTKVDSFLEENSVDITSVVAGLTSNNPAIMFAVKWIGDSIKRKKEEEKAARQAIDEASEVDTAGMERGGGAPTPVQDELVKVNEKLDVANNTNEQWRADDNAKAFQEEEERRESSRAREDQLEALETIANKDFTANVEVEGGDSGGFFDNLLGGLFGGKGGIRGALGGLATKFGPMLSAALPIAAVAGGLAMAVKDGWDIASAAFDDNIATEIEGEDIGGLAGAATGAAMGAAIGSVIPGIGTVIGGGIGAIIGSLSGSWLGELVDPNMDEVAQDTANQINDRRAALTETMGVLEQQLADGVISQEAYNAARAEVQAELDRTNALALENDQVRELQIARDRAAQEYNTLAAQIENMEEAGISVPQSMYDQLDAAEGNFYNARDAFETAADELNTKVDPSWWDSISGAVSGAVDSVLSAASTAANFITNPIGSTADLISNYTLPDLDNLTPEELAQLSAKASEIDAAVVERAGMSAEQLQLLADDLEMTPEEVATLAAEGGLGMARGMDALRDGATAATAAIGDAFTGATEYLGIDDEVAAVKDAVNRATEGAKAYWNDFTSKASEMKDRVLGFFGFGGDDEEDTSMQDQIDALELQIAEEEARIARSNAGENEYFGRESVGREESADRILELRSQADELRRQQEESQATQPSEQSSGVEPVGQQEDDTAALQQELDQIRAELAERGNRMPRSQARALRARGGRIQNELSRRELANAGYTTGVDENGAATIVPVERETGQNLNATQRENRDMQADAQASGTTNVVAPTNISTTNNSTVQRIQPRVPVRNQSDDYRTSMNF